MFIHYRKYFNNKLTPSRLVWITDFPFKRAETEPEESPKKERENLAKRVEALRKLKAKAGAVQPLLVKWQNYEKGVEQWKEVNKDFTAATGMSPIEIQLAVGAGQDGKIGPNTMALIAAKLGGSYENKEPREEAAESESSEAETPEVDADITTIEGVEQYFAAKGFSEKKQASYRRSISIARQKIKKAEIEIGSLERERKNLIERKIPKLHSDLKMAKARLKRTEESIAYKKGALRNPNLDREETERKNAESEVAKIEGQLLAAEKRANAIPSLIARQRTVMENAQTTLAQIEAELRGQESIVT